MRKTQVNRIGWLRESITVTSMLIVTLVGSLMPFAPAQAVSPRAPQLAPQSATAAPAWLEPRGLNIVDLIGLVPESHLKDIIVTFNGNAGMLLYESGQRFGDEVVLNTRVFPRYKNAPWDSTIVPCPAYHAYSDHWPSPTTALKAKVYSDGKDISPNIIAVVYFPSGQIQPVESGEESRERYNKVTATDDFDGEYITVPANMGCSIYLAGFHYNVTAEYHFTFKPKISIEPLGSESFTFHSYRGAGEVGMLSPLVGQMNRYGARHEKFRLNIPAGADYVLVKYPPQNASPYVSDIREWNVRQPSSGTYRLAQGDGTLSTDHFTSMLLPLHAQWQDVDQTGGEFLNQIQMIDTLTAPEYFVPTSVPFDECMINGGCPSELLDRINEATMNMTIYYYRVTRTAEGLTRIPLRLVGSSWGGQVQASAQEEETAQLPPAALPFHLYLGTVMAEVPPVVNLPADDPNGCPCGWFTPDGRMVDTIPGN